MEQFALFYMLLANHDWAEVRNQGHHLACRQIQIVYKPIPNKAGSLLAEPSWGLPSIPKAKLHHAVAAEACATATHMRIGCRFHQ